MRISLPNNWAPRPYQRPLWSYLSNGGKRAIEIAHRRWGKDDITLHHAACAAHERIGNYAHCLPEYSQARKAIWTAVNPHTGKRRIDEAFPPEIRENTNDQEMFIRLKCGSTWQVLGSDQYDRLVGTAYAGIVFSEWALANPKAWAYARPILDENNGWAAFITTPRGQNHAKAMFDMARANPKWFAELSTVASTGAITDEALREARAELIAMYGEDVGQAMFEQEYYCSFMSPVLGSYYAREFAEIDRTGRITDVPYQEGIPVHTAWDLGYSDDTSIWFYQMCGNEIHVIDFYTDNFKSIDEYCDTLLAKGYEYGMHYLPHDARAKTLASGGKSIQEQLAVRLGWGNIRIVPGLSLRDGIQAVRKIMPRVWFDSKCEAGDLSGVAALRGYRRKWDDDKKVYSETPMHDWCSHPSDAFRMLAIACREDYKPEAEVRVIRDRFERMITDDYEDASWKTA